MLSCSMSCSVQSWVVCIHLVLARCSGTRTRVSPARKSGRVRFVWSRDEDGMPQQLSGDGYLGRRVLGAAPNDDDVGTCTL